MHIQVVTLGLDSETGCFDTRELEALQASWEVLSYTEHLLVHEGQPRLALVLSCRGQVASAPRRSVAREAAPVVDPGQDRWRVELASDEQGLFDALRQWRNARARAEGKPPFVLLTNRQLNEIARRRPKTMAELGEISGIGEARLDQLGREILATLGAIPSGADVLATDRAGDGEAPE